MTILRLARDYWMTRPKLGSGIPRRRRSYLAPTGHDHQTHRDALVFRSKAYSPHFHVYEKTGPRVGSGFSDCRRGGRQHLPEGNMLHVGDSGRISIRRHSELLVCEPPATRTTPIATCQPCVSAA